MEREPSRTRLDEVGINTYSEGTFIAILKGTHGLCNLGNTVRLVYNSFTTD